jgi:cell wall assembly regulator SMI1
MYNLEAEKIIDKQATIKEIKEFEQKIEANLPDDYIQFLLKYNGVRFKQDSYDGMLKPYSNIDGGAVRWFYTLADSYNYNLLKTCYMYFNRIPKQLIPIAEDGGGNQICLAVRGENYGKVYFWDHDWESDEGEEPTYSNVYLIANNFSEFLNKLYELKLNDDGSWTKIYQDGTIVREK